MLTLPLLQREQAGAGLDCLTAQEMQTFTQLNDDYKAKFAFPFILAVKGENCDGCCAAVWFEGGGEGASSMAIANAVE